MRILLVEDDLSLAEATCAFLRVRNFVVDVAGSLQTARALVVAAHYEAVLLDLHLPDGDGLQLMSQLRGLREQPVVLVLTARDQISDRIRGLDAGADDYLVKPYDPEELLARLRAVNRRRSDSHASTLDLGRVHIDLTREQVTCDGKPMVLTPKEWALLRVMAARPHRVHLRETLQDALYGLDDSADSNTLEVFISRLRRKLGRDTIETVRGTGYRLNMP